MWNVFSPCFDWMGLVADQFKNTEQLQQQHRVVVSEPCTWWKHRASFMCGVVISAPQILLLIAFHSLSERAEKHEDT